MTKISRYFVKFTLSFLLIIIHYFAASQGEMPKPQETKELKYNLNQEGDHYIKATFLNQIWVRHTQNNPGSTVNGYTQNETFDIGLRRTRIQVFGQIHDKVFFYTQFGQNNLTYHGARKQGLFFHDAVAEYALANKYFSIGAGLTGWSGLSRYAAASVGTILSLDAPIYQQATNDVNDQFLRKYSVYGKGQAGKFDYRFALTKPMTISVFPGSNIDTRAGFSPEPPKLQYQGYVKYQFFENESNLTPYGVGTYLGKKKVLALGAGFILQENATWHTENAGMDTMRNDMALFAADVFFEKPINIEKENAFTAYACFSSTDFGKDYVRNVGVMNPVNGVNANGTLNDGGNAFQMVGTGNTFFGQIGYLFRRDFLGKAGTIQPYAAVQYSEFTLLSDPMIMYEGGLNWLIDGHRSKISLNYQNRPVFELNNMGDYINSGYRGMFVFQFQVSV